MNSTGIAAKLIARIYRLSAAGESNPYRPDGDNSITSDEEDLLNNVAEFVAVDCADELRETDAPWSPLELIDYLGAQLGKLEENFSGYMVSVSRDNSDYIERSFRLLWWMLADECPSGGILHENETLVVKFYGHSLGEADYAYFQAIFDSVNLYAGDTKLVFYYKPHGAQGEDFKASPLSEQRSRNNMAARVTRLLAEYGRTLDNEDHGRNLMHKLMIEGRLEVRRLKDEQRALAHITP